MKKTPNVYILLPVYNRKIITERFIACLVQQTWENYKLILIDDGSEDDTALMVKKYFPDCIVLKGNGHWWWAGSLQQGINWLKKHHVEHNDFVLTINDDVLISSDFLGNGIAFLGAESRTLLLAQEIDKNKTMVPIESGVVADLGAHTFKIAKNREDINCLSTRGLLMRFGDVLEIGNFCPRLLPHYGSDYEYTIRAYKKGFKLITDSSFFLEIDRSETGMHQLPDVNFSGYLGNVFSKRFVGNPIYRSTFICLTSPYNKIPILLYCLWKQTFISIYRKAKLQVLRALVNFKARFLDSL